MPSDDYEIVGSAWKKVASNGTVFYTLSFDSRIEKINVYDQINMFPRKSKKREGKEDPDYILSRKKIL